MSAFTDWKAKKPSGTPLDITGETPEGTQPHTTFADWKKSKSTEPTVDVEAIPVPKEVPEESHKESPDERLTITPQDSLAVPETASPQQKLMKGTQDSQYNYQTQPDQGEVPKLNENVSEFLRDEGLPVVGSLAAVALAPVTGGTSVMLSLALTAGATGVGAFAGEAIEQGLKKEGILSTGDTEEPPKDAWDVLNRATAKGTEEALWSLVPDVLLRGMPLAKRKLLTLGGRPTVTTTGEVVDMGRKNMIDMMNEYASKEGLNEGDVLLASDIANVPLFNMAEDVTRNSYIGGKSVETIRTTQEEAIKSEIKGQIGAFLDPAQGYISNTSNAALDKYIEPNMESLNSFAVAGLINTGFNRAQEAQKSVARGIYGTIGELMEQSTMKRVVKEVELPILGPNGKPITVMKDIIEEHVAFPVDLKGVSKFAEDHMDDNLFSADGVLVELVGLPSQSSYKQAANTLSDLKARSRKLKASMDEFAPRRLRLVNDAIDVLTPAVDDAMILAEKAGITGAGGESLTALKGQADSIWKEQVEDFQNSYISGILKNADSVNGAPDKLGSLFMQNEAAASKISKILKDSKGSLTGDALENVLAAENAMKGSIVQDIFMPFDNIKNEFIAPNTATLHAKADTLKRLFTPEEYKGLVKLSSVIDTQSRQGVSNFLGFAQRARESGMVIGTLKSLTKANFGPLIRDGGSTLLFSLGMGKILTNPKNLKLAAMIDNLEVPTPLRIQAMQQLAHRTYDYQRIQEDNLTEDQRERLQAAHDDREEAKRMQ